MALINQKAGDAAGQSQPRAVQPGGEAELGQLQRGERDGIEQLLFQ